MKRRPTLAAAALLAALCLSLPLAAQDGPTLDLPEEAASGPSLDLPGDGADAPDTTWGLADQRLSGAEGRTTIGGYGEVHYNLFMPEDGDNYGVIDVHRLVIFLAHRFSQQLSSYVELEVEHAFVEGNSDLGGYVALEQAYIDWAFHEHVGLHAGMFLIPMGIINEWHEPPVFHGVERPSVDRVVIPSTWREAGLRLYGDIAPGVTWQAAIMSGLDPLGFSAGTGLRGGRLHVAQVAANSPAFLARVEAEPTLGLVTGITGYYGNAGPNADGVDFAVPVVGAGFDARLRRSGFEAKLVAAYFSVGNTDRLRDLEGGPDIGSAIFGAYGELAYDVLRPADTSHELLPFARVERYDTTFAIDEDSLAGERGTTEYVFGLSYRPHPSVVFKQDVVLRRPDEGQNLTIFDLGVGWMF